MIFEIETVVGVVLPCSVKKGGFIVTRKSKHGNERKSSPKKARKKDDETTKHTKTNRIQTATTTKNNKLINQ